MIFRFFFCYLREKIEKMRVRAKKNLGQHFLRDEDVAWRIVDSLQQPQNNSETPSSVDDTEPPFVLEVGPGMGVLTKYLLKRTDIRPRFVELDSESAIYLNHTYPEIRPLLYREDFLYLDFSKIFGDSPFWIIGNFPYNISSQIFFKVLDHKDQIPQVVGMVQKEVGERLASGPGKKSYGILSVLLQAWYDIEYLFTVDEHVFAPPPKVKSAVIRLRRNGRTDLGCDANLFKAIVKAAFNQRRKVLSNSLSPLLEEKGYKTDHLPENIQQMMRLRPEQLSVEDFLLLTRSLEGKACC
jgi:16S rRNA (adenine1518-N6/adenine1519-N6)-dimethyltransferase